MLLTAYKNQMKRFGESYASAFYILAALILALCGTGLEKIFDSVAGCIFLIADIIILILQMLDKAQRARSLLLFGASLFGAIILLSGSIIEDIRKASTDFELFGAVTRLISNLVLTFASFIGLLSLFPKLKTPLPDNPGKYYLISYALFFIFAAAQFYLIPSILSLGYIIAVIFWLLASNAIRLKYDQ